MSLDLNKNELIENIHHRAPILGHALEDLSSLSGAPRSMCLAALLAAMCIASQYNISVQSPTGAIFVVSLYILILGESGLRKSTVFNLAMKAIIERDSKFIKLHAIKLKEYKADIDIWEEEGRYLKESLREALRREVEVDEAKSRIREHALRKPIAPRLIQLIYQEPTKSILLSRTASSGLGAFVCDEAADMFFNMLFDLRAALSSMWSGYRVKNDATNKAPEVIEEVRFSMLLFSQPEVFGGWRKRPKKIDSLVSQGFMPRFLVFNPVSNVGFRAYNDEVRENGSLQVFHNRSRHLLDETYENTQDQGFVRQTICLDPVASDLFKLISIEAEERQKESGRFYHAKAFGSKYAEQVLRIAAVIHYFEGFEGDISVETLKLSYAIAEQSAAGYLEVFSRPSQLILDAHKLFDWIIKIRGDGANEGMLNRHQFTRHLSAIHNGFQRGIYEQQALSRGIQD